MFSVDLKEILFDNTVGTGYKEVHKSKEFLSYILVFLYAMKFAHENVFHGFVLTFAYDIMYLGSTFPS